MPTTDDEKDKYESNDSPDVMSGKDRGTQNTSPSIIRIIAMSSHSCSRHHASAHPPTQRQRLQRLEESRAMFSTISRSNAGAFRDSKVKAKEEHVFQQQVREMHQVEDRLKQMRQQYEKVCHERGKAHQSAVLVRQQEQEIADFEQRRNERVRKHAEKVARKAAVIHHKKLTDRETRKQEQLERRKQVFRTDWKPLRPGNHSLQWTDKRTFAKELENLISLEKTIEQKVREKLLQQRQKQKVANGTTGDDPVRRSCHTTDGSCSASSCSCSGSSTPCSSAGSVICVEEIAEKVLSKLQSLKQKNAMHERPVFQKPLPEVRNIPVAEPVQVKNARNTQRDTRTEGCEKDFRETGVNTSIRPADAALTDPQLILCSSPSTSYRSVPDDGNNRFQELVHKLKDLSAIESPNEEENVSSFSSGRTITRNAGTGVKAVDDNRIGLMGDLSIGSMESLPHFPSFDRSFFWKDVFDSAGVSMSETIARVLRDAKRTSESIEKSLSLLSLSESMVSPAKDGTEVRAKTDAAVARLLRDSTPIASAASSPTKRTF